VFPLRTLLTLNLVLAIFGPAIVTLLVALQSLVVFNRRRHENGTIQGLRRDAFWDTVRQWFTHLGWVGRFWRWAKFWMALVVSVAMQVLLVFGYISLNPFVSHLFMRICLIFHVTNAMCSIRLSTPTHTSSLPQISPSPTSPPY
jgi:hypothetical protein